MQLRHSLHLQSFVFALILTSTSWAGDLQPRTPLEKPQHTELNATWSSDVITVKFQDGLLVRLRNGALTDFGTGALAPAASLLRTFASGTWQRAHYIDEQELDRLHANAERNLGIQVADLNLQFLLHLPAGLDAATVIDAFNALDCVELAQGVPVPAPSPVVPNFTGMQGYLTQAPTGTGSTSMSSFPGGNGSLVKLADVEYSWNRQHTDFPTITVLGPQAVDPFNDNNHGTATLGEILARNNGEGTTGAAYGVTAFASPSDTVQGFNVAAAITTALGQVHAGDVMLLEAQMYGPHTNPCCSQGNCAPGTNCEIGYVPVEWYLPTYNAIVTAVGNGVTVVEAAGNGSQNLDDPIYSTGNGGHWPFLPTHDSGAIIVGAGSAPPASGGSSVDRSRLGFSDYGSTVDLQGWGEAVATLGYGDLYSIGGSNYYYTGYFSGTSSASPIVASACIQVQSIMKALTGSPLTPAQVKATLRSTGSPQQSGAHPSSENIGPRPDVRAAIAALYPCFDAQIGGPNTMELQTCGSMQANFTISTASGSPTGGSWTVSESDVSGWSVHVQAPATGPNATLVLDVADAAAGSRTVLLRWDGTCSGSSVHFEKSITLQLDTSCAGPVSMSLASHDQSGGVGASASLAPTISADGGRVVFASQANNIVLPDSNGLVSDVYLYERSTTSVARVSVDSNGVQDSSFGSYFPSLSADGRFIAFWSDSPTLVQGDTNGYDDVFVRDIVTGTTARVSIANGPAGLQADGPSESPSISADGNAVAFASVAGNLATPAYFPFQYHVHVRDRSANTTTRIDVGPGGVLSDSDSIDPVISADGRFVAYRSTGTNLTSPGVNSAFDQIYVRDRQTLTTELVSVSSSGAPGANGECTDIALSADGRFVAFSSQATNLIANDANGAAADVYVRDRLTGQTSVASVGSDGAWGNAASTEPSISGDGRYVAFRSAATNLVAGDTNGRDDVFVHDRESGQTIRVSVAANGVQSDGNSGHPSLSADGRRVAFWSTSTNFPGGSNGQQQAYVRELGTLPVTIYCQGDGTAAFCPCFNHGAYGHGCSNSIFTDGATLLALGGASVSADTFGLDAGHIPNSSVLFFQGTTEAGGGGFGVWFGDGLRCAGGSIVRLGVRTGVSNSAQYPGVSGTPISIKGAIPGAGGVRTYQAWYRNATGLCGSGFNLTNGLLVTWVP